MASRGPGREPEQSAQPPASPMGGAGVFTRYLSVLEREGEPPPAAFDELWQALHATVVAELRRSSAWSSPPSYLGVFGWPAWQALVLPVAERGAFLERVCDDESLRREVEAFLERQDRLGDFLEQPFFSLHAAREDSDAGLRLGPYRLVRALGRGGMGVVYLAERVDGALRQRWR